MNTLPVKIALWFGVLFAGLATAAVAIAGAGTPRAQVPLEAIVATIGVTLVAAWCVLQPLARRAERLADRLAASEDEGAAHLPDADAAGVDDATATKLSERLSERAADRAAAVARLERQRHELLANVAHDLRTPLASLQGYLELMLLRHGSLAPAELQNYLQTAARQSERLARLVGDLFELTRLEAGDVELHAESFALAELVQDLLQRYAAEAERRGLRLAAADADRALRVRADIALDERALAILVDNALRHTPAGGAVTVRVAPAGTRVRLVVCDTGCGIAAEDLPGLFERYERTARAGLDGPPGLGLAMARRIAALHGSALCIRSARGAGTDVSFEPAGARTAAAACAAPSGRAA